MSKSLNNAIGIHEPPQEMYGKLMSINDELMWRYWTLLTDLRQSEIDAMRADVASGALHPMEAKKRLARTIVGGFWGGEEARAADEQWARQFQQKSDDVEGLEEVRIPFAEIHWGPLHEQFSGEKVREVIRLDQLMTRIGLAPSVTEANRLIKAGALRIDGETYKEQRLALPIPPPKRITVRVGKRAKIAVFE
jgi:tyrosyl-tRNA synthetase